MSNFSGLIGKPEVFSNTETLGLADTNISALRINDASAVKSASDANRYNLFFDGSNNNQLSKKDNLGNVTAIEGATSFVTGTPAYGTFQQTTDRTFVISGFNLTGEPWGNPGTLLFDQIGKQAGTSDVNVAGIPNGISIEQDGKYMVSYCGEAFYTADPLGSQEFRIGFSLSNVLSGNPSFSSGFQRFEAGADKNTATTSLSASGIVEISGASSGSPVILQVNLARFSGNNPQNITIHQQNLSVIRVSN